MAERSEYASESDTNDSSFSDDENKVRFYSRYEDSSDDEDTTGRVYVSCPNSIVVVNPEDGPPQKPYLCIDRGCITGSEEVSHCLAGNDEGVADSTTSAVPAPKKNVPAIWKQYANLPTIPVRCKHIFANLYKNRFASGNHGRCINYQGRWLTPCEFERFGGRGIKDWKATIKFEGISLRSLIRQGLLYAHPNCCSCHICVGDVNRIRPGQLSMGKLNAQAISDLCSPRRRVMQDDDHDN